MAEPIWKDHFSNLGAVASQYFRLRVNSTTVYQGRAFRAASSGDLKIKINDICADYIAKIPGGGALTFPVSFTVQKSSNGSSWTNVETVAFNDDWSYNASYNPSTDGMSFPVTHYADIRQHIYQTRYASGSVTATARYGSTTRSITLSLLTTTGSTDLIRSLTHAGVGYVDFDCAANATYSGKKLTSVTIGGVTYTITNACPEYLLYYKNPFGGYDHLVLLGKCRRNRTGQRDTFVADYNNNYQQRGEWVFQNEVTERFTLNTGLMADGDSERMPYLLDSPDVYLINLNSPTVFVPVKIATDSYQVKKYSVGEGMVNYTFEVEVTQNEYKR